MIAVIKKEGGYLIFTIKTSCYEALGFKDKLEGLVKEGKITLVKQYSWNKYEGMEKYKGLGIFQPDISHLLAFKVNKWRCSITNLNAKIINLFHFYRI